MCFDDLSIYFIVRFDNRCVNENGFNARHRNKLSGSANISAIRTILKTYLKKFSVAH